MPRLSALSALLAVLAAASACGGRDPAQPSSADAGVDAPLDAADPGPPPDDRYPDELLRNVSFEQLDGATTNAAGWEPRGRNPGGSLSVVGERHHDGDHALEWTIVDDGREVWVTQTGLAAAGLEPGATYELTGWYMMDTIGEAGFNYIVSGEPGGVPWLSTIPEPFHHPTHANTWEWFRFDIKIPTTAAPDHYDVSLHSLKFNHVTTRLTVDNVSLHRKPAAP